MDDERFREEELLDAWRDAASAAELAERLASEAAQAAGLAEANADAASEMARLARSVADSASHAAETARAAEGDAVARRAAKRPDGVA